MIQLSSDPNASRTSFRPQEGQEKAQAAQRRRSGHAWPFPSRYAARPQQEDKPSAQHSGS